MAEISTLARPYAKAVFEYAAATESLESWSETLSLLGILVQQEKLAKLLSLPVYTPQQQTQTLIDICGDALQPAQKNFIKVLSENRRLPLLGEISTQFEALKAHREKTIDVDVISASELSEQQREKLQQALSAKLERAVSMKVAVDPSLLGGALIRAGDTVIDGSIRGRLAKLSEAINL